MNAVTLWHELVNNLASCLKLCNLPNSSDVPFVVGKRLRYKAPNQPQHLFIAVLPGTNRSHIGIIVFAS
jgi:hypothetical protein